MAALRIQTAENLLNNPGKCRNNTGHVSYEQLSYENYFWYIYILGDCNCVQQPFHYYVFICMSSDYNTVAYEISCKIRLVLTCLCKIRGNYFLKIVIPFLLMESPSLQHDNLRQIKKPS